MSLKNSLYFVYDKKNSKTDFGLEILNINLSSGLHEEPFLSNREILEKKIRYREKPYLQEVRRSPLEFTITIALGNNGEKFTYEQIRKIATWFDVDFYKEMYFQENPNRVYLAMLNNESNLFTNGLNQGYIELPFHCDSPYSYTPKQITQVYDTGVQQIAEIGTNSTTIKLSNHGLITGDAIINKTINNTYRKVTVIDSNTLQVDSITGQSNNNIILKYYDNFYSNKISIDFVNNGDLPVNPKVYINKIGDGGILIKSSSDGNMNFSFNVGSKSTGILTFNDTVYNGDTVTIGNDIFEFSTTGVGTTGNLVNVSSGTVNSNAILSLSGNVFEGDTVTIGEDTFEFTNDDDLITSTNIPINIRNYSNQATNILTFESNPEHGTIVNIGTTSYTFVINTNESYIYLSNHGLTKDDLIINTSINSGIGGLRGLQIINSDCVKMMSQFYNTNSLPITNQVKGNTIVIYKMNTSITNKYKILEIDDTYKKLTIDSVNICNAGDIIQISIDGRDPIYNFVNSVGLTNSNSQYLVTVDTAYISEVASNITAYTLKVYNKRETKIAENALAEGGYKVLIDTNNINTIQNLMYAINNTANTIDIGTNDYNIKIIGHGLNPYKDYIINTTRDNTINGIRKIKYIDVNNFNVINPIYIYNSPIYPIDTQTSGDSINVYRIDDNVSYKLSSGSTNTSLILDSIGLLTVGDIIGLWQVEFEQIEYRFITNITGNTITVNQAFDITWDINITTVVGIHLLKTSIAEASSTTIEANTLYSSDIIKNTDVYATCDESGLTTNQIKLYAIKPGYEANSIATTIKNTQSLNKFTYSSLYGGYDCSNDIAKILLVNAINYNNIIKLNDTINYDKFKQYEVDIVSLVGDNNLLKIKATTPGTKGDNIILSSNGKNIYWSSDTLTGGKDPIISTVTSVLIDKINSLVLSYNADYMTTNKIIITYKTNGIDGNVPVTSNCVNAYWDNITLVGGSDELLHGEEIFVDNEEFIIQSSLENIYRTGIFSGNYLSLPVGVSKLGIYGSCTIQFIYYSKLRQG